MVLVEFAKIIRNDADSSALQGGRVYPIVLPEGTPRPATTYQIAGGSSEPTMNTPGMQRLRVQLDFHGDTYLSAATLRETVRKAVDGYQGVLPDGTYLDGVEHIQPVDYFDDEPRQYRCSSEYYLHFCLI